jgi:hypothetical protein
MINYEVYVASYQIIIIMTVEMSLSLRTFIFRLSLPTRRQIYERFVHIL